jgi:long-chain acyl-CoA synthetase
LACVIGKPDPQAGELPKAIVSMYEGKSATPEELLAHCRTQLDPDQVPVLIEIMAELPMTPTGKIGRAELQAREKGLADR